MPTQTDQGTWPRHRPSTLRQASGVPSYHFSSTSTRKRVWPGAGRRTSSDSVRWAQVDDVRIRPLMPAGSGGQSETRVPTDRASRVTWSDR
jgi:hypothetical protein